MPLYEQHLDNKKNTWITKSKQLLYNSGVQNMIMETCFK